MDTGFTGRLITRYLHAHREGDSFSFAIAGRSKSKLVDLAATLELPPSVPIFVVDVTRPDEVDGAVQKAKVVINTVGPYIKWGKPVVVYVLATSKLTTLTDNSRDILYCYIPAMIIQCMRQKWCPLR